MAEFAKTTTTEGFDIETNAQSQAALDRTHAPAEKASKEPPAPPEKPAGETADKNPPEEPKKEPAPSPAATDDADEDEKLSPVDRRKKVQARIDKITRERHAAERRAEEAARERDELKTRAERNEAELRKVREQFGVKDADPDKEPELGDFEDHEDYKKAFREFTKRQIQKEQETNAKRESVMSAKRERLEAFKTKIFEPAAADPTLFEGLPDDLLDSKPLSALKDTDQVTFGNFLMEILTRVKDPWVVLNHFKTPDGQTELQRLSTLHPSEVSMEIGMLYKGLSSATKTAPEEKPKPEISKAKPPGKAITAGPPSDSDPLAADIDFDEAAKRMLARKRK
jgi:hypothetical protein